MNFSFLPNMNFPFVQGSSFCNNSFLSFIETYVSFKHFHVYFEHFHQCPPPIETKMI